MIARKIICLMIFILVLCACSILTKPDTSSWPSAARKLSELEDGEFWTPTSIEQSRAEQLARWYATTHLGLSSQEVNEMKTQVIGNYDEGITTLDIDFYDPKVIQPGEDGMVEFMLGGFPSYFSITIDVNTWRVIDYYASPE